MAKTGLEYGNGALPLSSDRHTRAGRRHTRADQQQINTGGGNKGSGALVGRRRSFTGPIRVGNRLSLVGSVLQVPDRRLEKAQAGPRRLFGFPIALQFVFALQASPLFRIDGFKVGLLVFAIRGWLRREQRWIKFANSRLQIVALGVPAGGRTRRCGRYLDLRRLAAMSRGPGFCAQPATAIANEMAQRLSNFDRVEPRQLACCSHSQGSAGRDVSTTSMPAIPVQMRFVEKLARKRRHCEWKT